MAIITLLTDFGGEDYYTSVFKGELYKSCPSSMLVDISHNVLPYDIGQAAYLLKNTFEHFPEGSLHITRVYESASKDKSILMFKYKNHFFAGPDNGLLSMVMDEKPTESYLLNPDVVKQMTLDQKYAKIARTIVFNGSLNEIGIIHKDYVEKIMIKPVIYENRISGVIQHIDHFGNAITNITREDFDMGVKGRGFVINYRRTETISELHESYEQVPPGEKLARFNDKGFLEIAVNVGEAHSMLGLNIGGKILIEIE